MVHADWENQETHWGTTDSGEFHQENDHRLWIQDTSHTQDLASFGPNDNGPRGNARNDTISNLTVYSIPP